MEQVVFWIAVVAVLGALSGEPTPNANAKKEAKRTAATKGNSGKGNP